MATTNSSPKVHQVAVLLFPGADLLDFAGPIEMLTHASHSHNPQSFEPAFATHTIAESSPVRVGAALTVNADLTLQEASKRLEDFEILIVPGGRPNVVLEHVEKDSPEVQFVRNFATHSSSGGEERVVFSVCTGALLLAGTGAVGGLTLTTHHMAYNLLREVCQNKAADGAKPASVVESSKQRRYVDGGLNGKGVRVLSAGGITCGLDASLYLAEMKAGKEAAAFAAKISEHEWQRAV